MSAVTIFVLECHITEQRIKIIGGLKFFLPSLYNRKTELYWKINIKI